LDDTDPIKIINHFYNATIGQYTYYYQQFWPIFGEKERLFDLDQACIRLALEPAYQGPQRHRLISLPALARIHALAALPPEETTELDAAIVATHRRLLDDEPYASRAGVESIWQTLTAATIRNQGNWATIIIGADLLEEAERVCIRWLKDEPLLFHAAIVAWQFLLTYLRTPRVRSDRQHAELVAKTLARIEASAAGSTVSDVRWLTALTALYRNRTEYEDMLPQTGELFLGVQGRNIRRSEGFLYALNVRMENEILNRLVEAGEIRSPLQTPAFAKYSRGQTWSAIHDYDITSADWENAKTNAAHFGIPTNHIRDSQINEQFRALPERSSHETQGTSTVVTEAEEMRALDKFDAFPFRKTDAETVFDSNAARQATNNLDNMIRAGSASLGSLFVREIEAHTEHLAQVGNFSVDRSVLIEEVDRVVSAEAIRVHEPCFERLRDEYRWISRTSVRVSRPKPTFDPELIAASPTEKRIAHQDITPERISNPLGLGRGETDPPLQGGQDLESGHTWRQSIGSYRYSEVGALTFSSRDEFDRAVDLIYSDPTLSKVPRTIANGTAIIVPNEAVPLFGKTGLLFKVESVFDPNKLSEAQRLAIQEIRSRRKAQRR
jgi:hypothetical protein